MAKKRRSYEPGVFDDRIITSDEIERIHKGVLEFERIEAISDPMRKLIEDLYGQSWCTSCRRQSRGDRNSSPHIVRHESGPSARSPQESRHVASRAIWHHRAMLESGARPPPHCVEAVHSRLRAAQVVSDCRTLWFQNSTLTERHVHANRLLVANHGHVQAASSAHSLFSLIELCCSCVRPTVAKLSVGWYVTSCEGEHCGDPFAIGNAAPHTDAHPHC
jgi:hypothetical protein